MLCGCIECLFLNECVCVDVVVCVMVFFDIGYVCVFVVGVEIGMFV